MWPPAHLTVRQGHAATRAHRGINATTGARSTRLNSYRNLRESEQILIEIVIARIP